MSINRRHLIGLSAAGAAALALGAPDASAAPTGDIRSNVQSYFGEQGFATVPPLDLITGQTFNGGLRYDESRAEKPSSPSISIQPSARIEDIAQRGQPGVLAGFHIIALSLGATDKDHELVVRVVDYLVVDRKLDPEKMLFVSTSHFRPYFERKAIVRSARFLERDMAEAKAAGDGSGFFAPKGHPAKPHFHTAGLYYAVPGASPPSKLQYPPQGYIELAEIQILPPGAKPAPHVAGIGLERLAMAEGKPAPDFEQSRRDLLKVLEQEAKRTGKPLPPGHAKFSSL